MLRLRFGNRFFAPGIPGTAATLVLLAALVGLGTWQLERMREKAALFEAFETGGRDVADYVTSSSRRLFQRFSATGHYDSGRQILLDNMTHEGRAGYHVLTPFVMDAGSTLLVNRGWIAAGATRQDLPDIEVGGAPRRIVGRLAGLPRPGIELDAADDLPPTWPKVMSYPRPAQVRAALGEIEPGVILLDAAQPDGYVREWRPTTFPPQRHLGYAITWFALAGTVLVVFVIVSTRKDSKR